VRSPQACPGVLEHPRDFSGRARVLSQRGISSASWRRLPAGWSPRSSGACVICAGRRYVSGRDRAISARRRPDEQDHAGAPAHRRSPAGREAGHRRSAAGRCHPGTGHRRRGARPRPPAGPAAVRRAPGRRQRVYLGFAVADGRRSALLVQTGELLGFTALAALAVQRDSPGLLGAGWLAHVTWDALFASQLAPSSPCCCSRWARGWPPAPCTGSAARCAAAGRPAGPSSRWRWPGPGGRRRAITPTSGWCWPRGWRPALPLVRRRIQRNWRVTWSRSRRG